MVNKLSKIFLYLAVLAIPTLAYADLSMWPAGSSSTPSAQGLIVINKSTCTSADTLPFPTTADSVQYVSLGLNVTTCALSMPAGGFDGQTARVRICAGGNGGGSTYSFAGASTTLRGMFPNNISMLANKCDTYFLSYDISSSTCSSGSPCWFLEYYLLNQ